MRYFLFNLLVFVAVCGASLEAAVIDVGNHLLAPNLSGQQVELYVAGGEQIAGIDFFAQVGDGGPELVNVGLPAGTDGPEITAVDLKSGTIFAPTGAQQVEQQRFGVEQVFFAAVAISDPPPAAQTVAASGLFARLTVDTTGLTEGTFDLLLADVLPEIDGGPFATRLVADDGNLHPLTIINGTLSISGSNLPGDYNSNGVVDAADYTRWRDQLGMSVTLVNENPAATTPGLVDQEDYVYWQSRFGATVGNSSTAAVPEPFSWLLVLCAMALLGIGRSNWLDLSRNRKF